MIYVIKKDEALIHFVTERTEKSNIGNKAYFLFMLSAKCQIPSLICIDSKAFYQFLRLKENRGVYDKILQSFSNKIGLMNVLNDIQNDIMHMFIPDNFCIELKQGMLAAGIKGTIAVRSSSLYEDCDNRSGAGVYESFTNIKPEDVVEYIKKCWASQFSIKALSYNCEINSVEQLRIGVIIQQYIKAERSGVIFSIDPVCPEKGMRIESVAGSCEKLMSGEKSAERVTYAIIKEEKCLVSKTEDINIVEQLCPICKKIRDELGYEIDMEWGYLNDQLYIFQCRPITAIVREPNCEWLKTILDIDDIPNDEMGALTLKNNLFHKKSLFYKFCKLAAVPTLPWYFLRYSKSSDIDEYAKKITNGVDNGYYSIMLNSLLTDFHCNSNDLPLMLRHILTLCKTEYITISIRYIPKNEYSLISFYDPLINKVRIECVPGAMKGLKSGYLQPSVYISDEKSNIIEAEKIRYKQYYDIDILKDLFYLVDCDMIVDGIDDYIREISTYTVKLYGQFILGAVEWWICNGIVYATDCSIEKGKISNLAQCKTTMSEYWILSKGHIRGGLCIISDDIIQELDSFSYSSAVSVTKHDKNIYNISIFKRLLKQIEIIREKYGNVILVAERPILSLSPLLNSIDGIIFKEASMLCHLSVIIREKNIPAICVGDNFETVKSETFYMI